MPRALLISHSADLGGAELTLSDVASHLGRSARVLLLADGPFRERLQGLGVPVEVLPADTAFLGIKRDRGFRPGALLGAVGTARRVRAEAGAFDVVFANTQKAFVLAALASVPGGKPLVWYLHDLLTREHFGPGRVAAVIALARVTRARVLTHSAACRDAFVAAGGSPARIHRLPYGVDARPFSDVTSDQVEALRTSLGVHEAPCVGVFSRLAPWKGQHVLLEALTQLPRVHALLVGDPLFGEEDYLQRLRARASALGLDDRVHFLGFREDVAALMSAVDIVVHTSIAAEPFGRVILEGMLAHRPVIATRGGGASEIVEPEVTGLLVEPGSAAALRSAIAELLADPPRRQGMGLAGRARAEERFSCAAMCGGIAEVLREASSL